MYDITEMGIYCLISRIKIVHVYAHVCHGPIWMLISAMLKKREKNRRKLNE